MTTEPPQTQERIARELLTQDPTYLGTADGVAVYWDSYEQTAAVVGRDGDADTIALADTPFDSLREYCEHVRDQRGWDVGPRVSSSIVDQLTRGIEA